MKKNFPINEKTGFEFKADAYNFINHPNWAGPQLEPDVRHIWPSYLKNQQQPSYLAARIGLQVLDWQG